MNEEVKRGEKVKGSWRTAFGYKYLSSEDIDVGQLNRLTITEVTHEMAYDKQTKEDKPLVSVWFEETERAMALNATNAKAISEIAGTSKVEKWAGTQVVVFNSGETFFGRKGALRIKKPEPPRAVAVGESA